MKTNQTACQHAMSVDVEDYYHVAAFEKVISPDQWSSFPSRVANNTHRILELFAQKNTKATFFMLGCVAEQHPDLVRAIVAQGHELASHGYQHVRVFQQTPEQFFQDISRTRGLLQDLSGAPVRGYRAATYSITLDTLWAYPALLRAGYRYSSSVYPVQHDLYGIPSAPRQPFKVNDWLVAQQQPALAGDLLEIPLPTVDWLGKRWPVGGGGFFRLLPYGLFRYLLSRHQQQFGSAGFYFHPWEIDPQQPRVANASRKSRLRHYLNLQRTEPRLKKLLEDFDWQTMEQVFMKGTL